MKPIKVNLADLMKHIIDYGDEGIVCEYTEEYAAKVFIGHYYNKYLLAKKMRKVEAMLSLEDSSFTFPIGLMTTNGYEIDSYYMRRIKSKKNIRALMQENDKEVILPILLEAENALKRAHDRNIVIGDIKGKNILLDENNHPIFIDTDNYNFENYWFTIFPVRANTLHHLYGVREDNYKDNDIFLMSLLSLELITKDIRFEYGHNRGAIEAAIKQLELGPEEKEIIDCIFSDAEDKPYIGKVLQKII